MDMILLTSQLNEIGPCYYDADFDCGDPEESPCDFQINGRLPVGAGAVYVPGTEFGGLFEYEYSKAGKSVIGNSDYKKGYTWRGLLSQWVICPPAGQDYKIVSGDANAVLKSLLSDVLGGFFYVPESASGITISSYQFKLCCTVLEGVLAMCADNDAKLVIHADKVAAGYPVQVTAEIKPAATIDGLYNDDSPVPLIFTSNKMGINHLICMGQGQLQQRQRVDLYVNNQGKIGTTKYYTGRAERQAYYDYSGAQSEAELISYGKKRLKELASANSLEVGQSDLNADIGDIIKGTKGSVTVQAPIARKILSVSGGIFRTECKVKGET